MRDEQVRRYARQIALPDVGGLGQTGLMVAAARVPLRESEPAAELTACAYLAAGGLGTLVMPGSTEQQRAEIAAHGPDTKLSTEGDGKEISLAPRPAWWPSAPGDAVALAYWRGSIAAATWMADVITR